MQNHEDDAKNVALIKKGGKSREIGISKIYEVYHPWFIKRFRYRGTSESVAEDIIQRKPGSDPSFL